MKISALGVLLLSLFISLGAYGQGASISAEVYDLDEGYYLPGANVALKDTAGVIIRAEVTGEDGRFKLVNVREGEYVLEVSYIGYAVFSQALTVAVGEEIILGKISLGQESALLNEVEVTALTPPVRTRGDTTEFNAAAYKTAPNSMTEGLIRKMPGMEVNPDGTVSAQGEQVRRVLVDGQPFFSDDPAIAMKNLPADIISSVQVFDQLSEQSQFTGFDDGERVRTMNIVTREDKRTGQFGRLYAGYGTEDRYEAGGSLNYFKGNQRIAVLGLSNNINNQNFATQDILGALGSSGRGGYRGGGSSIGYNAFTVSGNEGINQTHSIGAYYSNKWNEKLALNASYFVNKANNNNETQLFRDYLSGVIAGQQFEQADVQKRDNLNHRTELRLDYTINEKQSILYTPSFRWQGNNSISESFASTVNNEGVLLNESDLSSNLDRSAYQWDNRLLFRQRFEKKGRSLSLDIRAFVSNGDGESSLYSLNRFVNNTGEVDTTLFDQFSPFDQIRNQYRGTIRYTEPLGENGQLQFQHRSEYIVQEESRLTYEWDPIAMEYNFLVNNLSTDLTSIYTKHTPGVSYRWSKDAFSANVELETQWADLDNDIRLPGVESTNLPFFNVLPSFHLSYRKSRSEQFRLIYRTGTNEPSAGQLQTAIDNSDPLNVRSGNPLLNQEFQHRFIIRYSKTLSEKGLSFFGYGYYQIIEDRIANSRTIATDEIILPGGYLLGRGGQFTQPVNLSGYQNARSYLSMSVPVWEQKLNINGKFGFSYSVDPAIFNGELTKTTSFSWQPGITISSNISEKTDFILSATGGLNDVGRSGLDIEDVQYSSLTLYADVKQFLTERIFIQSDISYFRNYGLSDDFTAPWLLWRASMGVLLFPKKQGSLDLQWFDISGQNNSIERILSDLYVEDRRNTVLNSYLLLRFTYFLNAFPGLEEEGPGHHGRGGYHGRDRSPHRR